MYAHGFRFYFTPLTGVLFAFPSRYWFTIGRQVVFSLRGWSPYVQTGYHVSRPTLRSSYIHLRIREYHSVSSAFPCSSTCTYMTFGLFPFRSPLLWKSLLISFPQGTEMFHFPWFASIPFGIDDIAAGLPHSDITGYCAPYRLACAFRRLARPSSPPDAMASTMCAYSLDHTTPDCS